MVESSSEMLSSRHSRAWPAGHLPRMWESGEIIRCELRASLDVEARQGVREVTESLSLELGAMNVTRPREKR